MTSSRYATITDDMSAPHALGYSSPEPGTEPGTWTSSWRAPDNLRWFDGHFPGAPILPGFAVLEIALAMASDALGTTVVAHGAKQCKFRRPVVPGTSYQLALSVEDQLAHVLWHAPAGEVVAEVTLALTSGRPAP